MKIKIYKLIDPSTEGIRYIGRTKQTLEKRLSGHITESKSNHNTYKLNWIRTLSIKGLKPRIELIKTLDCTWKESHSIEIEITKEYFEKGCKLVNLVDKGAVLMEFR